MFACPHVGCTVQATLCYMQWIVLTHPLVNLDQCPLDFLVLSPFKTNRFESDEVRMVVQ